MSPLRTIKNRLLLFTLSLSLIPIIAVTAMHYFNARATLKRQIFGQLRAVAESKRIHFLHLMEAKKARVIDFSTDGFIRNGLERIIREGVNKDHEVPRLNRYLSRVKLPLCNNLVAITLINKDGTVIASTSERLVGTDMSYQDTFTRGIKLGYNNAYIGQPYHDPYLDQNCISISAPVTSYPDTEPVGIVLNTYNIALFNTITKDLTGMRRTGEVYLVNRDKVMLTESRFTENAPLNLTVDTEPVRMIVKDGSEMTGIYTNYRGRSVIGTSMYIPEYDWALLSEIDRAEAFEPLWTLGLIALIFGIASTGAVVSLGVIFALSLSTPIRVLKNAAERFTRGELDYRVEIIRKDEIGSLACSINTMAEELAREIGEHKKMEQELRVLNESLEQRVAERTAELRGVNEELKKEIAERKRVEDELRQTSLEFRKMMNSISDCVWSAEVSTVGGKFFYRYYSPVVEKITGRPPEFYIQGRERWLSTIYAEDRIRMEKASHRIITGQSSHEEEEYRVVLPDGRIRWVRDSVVAKRTESGILRLHGVVSDITERRRMEDALEKSRASLANAQRIAHLGSWEWDIIKDTVTWSDEVYRIFGAEPQSFAVTLEGFLDLVHPGDRESVRKAIHEAVYEKKPYRIDHRIPLPDGSLRFAHCEGEVLRGDTGRAVRMNGIIQDVTELKKIEEELKVLNESLEKRVEERTAELMKVNEKLRNEIVDRRHAEEELYESRERYRSLVENALDVIFTLARDGMITSLNPAFETITGWSRNEWMHKHFFPLIHPDERSLALGLFRTVLQGGTVPTFELRILCKSGEYAVGEFKATPQVHKESIVGALGIARNITDRKRAEEALRASEGKYRLLFESLPQRIFYKDKNSVYISCNKNLARDLHIKPDEIKGKTDYDFYPEKLAERYRMNDKRAMESGQTEEAEEKYFMDGQECIIHITRTPVKDEKGEIIGILGIFWDITEKVTLQREAEQSRHLAALGELAAGIGHEINNPISGVINYAQMLYNKSREGSRERDIASRIIKEGDRIARITSRLLSFAKAGDVKERKGIVSIEEIFSDTFILTEAQIRKEHIKVITDIPQDLPKVIAHLQQIQQVFLNIINNARYALNQKYPGVHNNKILDISAEEILVNNCLYVKITFCDHGTGIPAGVREKIMRPFFTTKPRGEGTGLGLSISYGIMKDHEGRLMIDSVEGEYTKIILLLPAFKPGK
ncbi:MAG: PAS domain S-box protein [wastewater metagenome]|nr:PAS domain S-box protein [Candidatus Loosdrechtia aerotolerans]